MKRNALSRLSSLSALGLALSAHLVAGAALAQGSVTLKGLALDTADNNRFFTRLGGTVGNALTYTGLSAGEVYTASGQLYNLTTKSLVGDAVTTTFTPRASSGTAQLELPVPQNRTAFNIDYVVVVKLYKGETATGDVVAKLDDLAKVVTHVHQGAIDVDGDQGGGQGAGGLVSQQLADLTKEFSKTVGVRVAASHPGQLVLDEGVVHHGEVGELKGHGSSPARCSGL